MRKLNLLFKLTLSAGIILFSFSYESVWYNLAVILAALLLIRWHGIRLFRFRSLIVAFLLFLLTIFAFRAFSGYGKIILQLPLGLTLTSGGLRLAVLVTEDILLVFLLMGLSIHSSSRQELAYYTVEVPGRYFSDTNFFVRLGRIGLYVIYLLPAMFIEGKSYQKLLSSKPHHKFSVKTRFFSLISIVGDFVVLVIRKAEMMYPEFLEQMKDSHFRPISVNNYRHGMVAIALVSIHGLILWF